MMPQPAEHGLPRPRGRKAKPWREDPVILARLPEIERRYVAGETNLAIAAAMGLDERTVRRDVDRLDQVYLERIGEAQQTLRARRIRELELVRSRALQAVEWDHQAERAVLFGVAAEVDGESLSVHRDDKGSAQFRGNKAAALDVARKATMDIAKLQGLVVDKVSPTDPEGNLLNLAALVQLARDAEEPRHGMKRLPAGRGAS